MGPHFEVEFMSSTKYHLFLDAQFRLLWMSLVLKTFGKNVNKLGVRENKRATYPMCTFNYVYDNQRNTCKTGPQFDLIHFNSMIGFQFTLFHSTMINRSMKLFKLIIECSASNAEL